MTADEIKQAADGQSDPEYATVLLRICGLEETWTQVSPGRWVSSLPEIRRDLESIVREIKRQVVENVEQHRRMLEAEDAVQQFLER